MTEREGIPFDRGMPTGPEVTSLMEAFPEIEKLKGEVITHKEIQGHIKCEYPDGRYKIVVGAWRRRLLREKGIHLKGDRFDVVRVGFAVLTADEQVIDSIGGFKKAYRQIGRNQKRAFLAEESELDAIGKRRRLAAMEHGAHIRTAMLAGEKTIIQLPTKPEQAPRTEEE